MKLLFIFFITLSLNGLSQKIDPENLSPKIKEYWDPQKKFIQAQGCYFQDENHPQTQEKHGKWLYYTLEGTLEGERNYLRNRLHGKQIEYYANKKIKKVYYTKYNVVDSVFIEYNDSGTLTTKGYYEMGFPQGKWLYYYPDSTIFKEEFVFNETTYLIDYREGEKPHLQTVEKGNGYVKTYYLSGALKESYQFVNGLKEGAFFENLASGGRSIVGEFRNGKKNGQWLFYFLDGDVEKEMNYVGDSLDGVYMVFYSNKKIQTQGQYQNGSKTGDWLWYSDEGRTLDMTGQFKNNLQDGDWNYYYTSGQLSYNAHYLNGIKSGVWEYFYKDGQVFKKGGYLNDLKSGKWQTWYEDGTLLMDGVYVKGREQGLWNNYWQSGRIKNETNFEKGKLDGAWHSYSESGSLKLFGRYHAGLKTGKWTSFTDSGHKQEEKTYKVKTAINKSGAILAINFKAEKSLEHGRFLSYSNLDHSLKEKGSYKNGEKSGTWINYHPGGVVRAVISNYKKGKLHGNFNQYDRAGNKLNQIGFKNGLKHGLFIVYNQEGKPIVEKMFSNGQQVYKKSSGGGFSPN